MRHEFGRAVRHAISAALLGPVLAPGPAVLAGSGDFPAVEQVVVADFDGDQVADVAVGIPDLKAGKLANAGAVRAFSGKTGQLLWNVEGHAVGQRYGCAVTLAGDLNRDETVDLAVGLPWTGANGSIVCLSGKDGRRLGRFGHSYSERVAEQLHGFYITNLQPWGPKWIVYARANDGSTWWGLEARLDVEGYFNSYEAGRGSATVPKAVGDFDGDLCNDVAMCTPSADGKDAKGSGRIKFLDGFKIIGGHSKEPKPLIRGERIGTVSGESLGSIAGPAGDWDGDKKGDVLVGSRGDDRVIADGWTLRVVSVLDERELAVIRGPQGERQLSDACVINDVTGDGKRDIVVGASARERGAGAVSLLSGADGSVVWSVVGARREGLGERIYAAALPHVSDFEYVWVEAPGVASNGAKGAGYPRLVYGKTGLTVASVNPYANKVKK